MDLGLVEDEHVRRYVETNGEEGFEWRNGSKILILFTKGRKSGQERANALIFEPGFSTYDAVSEHAGRGVGLDVVSTRVRETAGEISVSTAAGKYTRFRVLLPRLGSGSAASVDESLNLRQPSHDVGAAPSRDR